MLADDVDIQEHYREWLANVGYIPQMIFLLDADIRKNVAFGVPEEEIDDERLWHALKDDPEVLILDEATSALDNETEAAIMESINRLHGKKTLVIIAHRLQTIEKCDMVFVVENGKIVQE